MKTLFVLPLIGALSTVATANDYENTGFYGSAGGGVYRLESQGFDDTAATLKLLGGYSVNPYVAFETSYNRLLETSDLVDDVRVKVDGDTWDVSAKLSYPFADRHMGYARIGWSFYDLDAEITEDGQRETASDNHDAFLWALGGGMNLTPRLTLNGEYSRVLLRDADLDTLALDLAYRFGNK